MSAGKTEEKRAQNVELCNTFWIGKSNFYTFRKEVAPSPEKFIFILLGWYSTSHSTKVTIWPGQCVFWLHCAMPMSEMYLKDGRGLLYHYNLTSEERGTKTTPVQNLTYLETALFTSDIAWAIRKADTLHSFVVLEDKKRYTFSL